MPNNNEIEMSCATCRFVATSKRPKIMDQTGFDDQLMFEDVDEVVYTCKADGGPHAGNEIGPLAIFCSMWDQGLVVESKTLSELDRLIAAREARMKDKE